MLSGKGSMKIATRRTRRDELWAFQDFAARSGTRGECFCQLRDDWMSEPFFGHPASDVGNVVGQLSCEFIGALNHRVGINAKLFGQPAPVVQPDITQAVFTA